MHHSEPRTDCITSLSNKTFRDLRALLTGRGVKRFGRTLVSGSKVVPEVIRDKPGIIRGWIAPPQSDPPPVGLPESVERISMSRALFHELDVNGTGRPLLVVDVPPFDTFMEDTAPDDVLLFVPFQDPVNVGAVIRSAAAFGIPSIVLLREAANPYHPKGIRAAGTPLFNMRLYNGPSIEDVCNYRRPVIALAPGGEDIKTFGFPSRFILLPGQEGRGLPDSLEADHVLSIPIEPRVESLNATVAVSIALHAWYDSRR